MSRLAQAAGALQALWPVPLTCCPPAAALGRARLLPLRPVGSLVPLALQPLLRPLPLMSRQRCSGFLTSNSCRFTCPCVSRISGPNCGEWVPTPHTNLPHATGPVGSLVCVSSAFGGRGRLPGLCRPCPLRTPGHHCPPFLSTFPVPHGPAPSWPPHTAPPVPRPLSPRPPGKGLLHDFPQTCPAVVWLVSLSGQCSILGGSLAWFPRSHTRAPIPRFSLYLCKSPPYSPLCSVTVTSVQVEA